MTSDEERMALLAGRPLDALDEDEREQMMPLDPPPRRRGHVGGARARSRGSGRRLDRRGPQAEHALGDDQPQDRLVGTAPPGGSGRRRGHRRRGLPDQQPRHPTGRIASPAENWPAPSWRRAPPGRSPSSRTVPDSACSSRPPICPPRRWPLLPGLAQGSAGQHPHRDLQRGQRRLGDAVVGRLARRLPDPQRDHRGARRQPGVLRPTGARRRDQHLTSQPVATYSTISSSGARMSYQKM